VCLALQSGVIYLVTVHRPEAQYTDAARGKIGFESGRHSWDVLWRGPLGTVAMVGVATKEAPMRMKGYKPLLGSTDQSWAWNLVDNYLFHGGARRDPYPKCNNPPKYQVKIVFVESAVQELTPHRASSLRLNARFVKFRLSHGTFFRCKRRFMHHWCSLPAVSGRDERPVIFFDPDPVLNFENSVQVQT